MNILKNPIVLAIITGIIIFVAMTYFNKPKKSKSKQNKPNKSKEKRDNSFFSDTKETNILVAVIAFLATWYIAYSYLDTNEKQEGGQNQVNQVNQVNEENTVNLSVKSRKIPSISTEEVTRSYNILGSGLNVPKNELRLPNVLIDVV